MRVQLLLLKNHYAGKSDYWINPAMIVYAETGSEKTDKPNVKINFTILHIAGGKEKIFVKESPEEINRIILSIRQDEVVKTEVKTSKSFK